MPTISEHDALPTGARLGEFEIQQVLGIGGFGIVYLAFDHALERQVAIKEYMPAALASRGQGSEVVVRSASHADTFMLGMRSFINEARLLARFDHPSLVKVYRFWEQHGTAYMVMPYYKGRTLQDVRRDMTRPPDEAWLRRLIMPLLGALECLHREHVYHRDVAPDNILLLDDDAGPGRGRPVLLDLGAARRVIGDHTQTLTAIVKPSFAPIEQYAETVQLRQGPWTDLYALAAVVHFCITGRPPLPATARTVHDDVATLRQMSASLASGFDCHFSEAFVCAIDHALAVRPQDRPESVAAWRDELQGSLAHPVDLSDAVLEPKSVEWLTETVLVRTPAGDEDAALPPPPAPPDVFMTTVPAAGRLHVPPAWPPAQVAGPGMAASRGGSSTPQAPRQPGRPADQPAEPQTMSDEAAQALRAVMASTAYAIPQTIPIARPASARAPAGADGGVDVDVDTSSGDTQLAASAAQAQEGARAPAGPMASEAVPEPHLAGRSTVLAPAQASDHPWAIRQSPSWLRWSFGMLALLMGLAIWWSQTRGGAAITQPSAHAPQDVGLTPSTSLSRPPSQPSKVQAQADVDKDEAAADEAGKAHNVAADRRDRALRQEPGRAEAPAPLNPRRACGDRTFIMLAICMKRHCARPEYSAHGECVRMREQEARQQNNYYP